MRKLQVMLRVVVVLLLLGWSGSLLPRSMAQTNSNSQPVAAQVSASALSTITNAVSTWWQKVVTWLVADARSDQPNAHVVQTSG
jgi:protein-S-isoprenylcysteine O-methyltransferase Ste14